MSLAQGRFAHHPLPHRTACKQVQQAVRSKPSNETAERALSCGNKSETHQSGSDCVCLYVEAFCMMTLIVACFEADLTVRCHDAASKQMYRFAPPTVHKARQGHLEPVVVDKTTVVMRNFRQKALGRHTVGHSHPEHLAKWSAVQTPTAFDCTSDGLTL